MYKFRSSSSTRGQMGWWWKSARRRWYRFAWKWESMANFKHLGSTV